MTGYVLVIEDKARIEPLLLRVVSDTFLSVVTIATIAAAKRKLVESQPVLIAADVNISGEIGGGFKLARELSEHQSLASIPLFLFSDKLNEEVIREATSSGAKALIPWPISQEALKQRLSSYIAVPTSESAKDENEGETINSEVKRAASSPAELVSAEKSSQTTGAISPVPNATAEVDVAAKKLQLAQQILAKVLHNLKTSALLDVVDLEDVPQVVAEITKAVCSQIDSNKVQSATLESALSGKKS